MIHRAYNALYHYFFQSKPKVFATIKTMPSGSILILVIVLAIGRSQNIFQNYGIRMKPPKAARSVRITSPVAAFDC